MSGAARHVRVLLGALGAGLAALALAGCANGTLKAADVTVPHFGENAHGTVTVWCRADTQAAEEQIAKRFNATHPHLHVRLVVIADSEYETKLATAIRGGYVPDVIDFDDINTQLFIYHDAFDDLSPLIDKLPYRSKLAPAMLSLSEHDGHYFGVPFSADVSLLYWNKVLFRRAGLNPDRPPQTMAQEVSDARAITKLGHGIKGYSFGGDQGGLIGFTMLPQLWAEHDYLFHGATGHQSFKVSGNTPLAQVIGDVREMWRDGSAPTSDHTQTGATWGKDFEAGTVGMWPGNWGTLVTAPPKFAYGVEELPGPTHGSSEFAGGDSVAIPRGAGNPSGAWEYIKFALQPAQQLLLPKAGFAPVRTDVRDSPVLKRFPGPRVALDGLADHRAYAPNTIAYEPVMNNESSPFQQMFMTGVFGHGSIPKLLRSSQSTFDDTMENAQS